MSDPVTEFAKKGQWNEYKRAVKNKWEIYISEQVDREDAALEVHVDALLMADRPGAEHGLDVDDPDATDLHVVLLQLVAPPEKDVVSSSGGDDQIICDEAVSALDEIENALALADPALPHEEEPDAVHVGQGPVDHGGRREGRLQIGLDAPVERARRETAPDYRYVTCRG